MVLAALALMGCVRQSKGMSDAMEVKLADLGPAPELMNDIWLNVDRPLRLAELKGRVVLLEMWTFG